MIRFKATKEQVQQMAANAVIASEPMGTGFLHYDPNQIISPRAFEIIEHGKAGLFLDYVGGRMVKLTIWKTDDHIWEMRNEARSDCQSWARSYPDAKALINSVRGIEILE